MVAIKRSVDLTSGLNPVNQARLDELFNRGIESDSGERVTMERAMGLPAVLNAVRIISTSAARTDCFPFIQLEGGGSEIDKGHPVYSLLTSKANPFTTSYSWMQTWVANAALSGNGYSLVIRDQESFDPVALYNLDSRQVYQFTEWENGQLVNVWYNVTVEGQNFQVPADDILHIKNISLHTGTTGLSFIQVLQNNLGLHLAVQKYGTIFFRHGQHINKVLKIPGWLTEEQRNELRESMIGLHGGLNNAHKLAVLMGGSELESLPISNEEAQWLESRDFSLIDLANFSGVPVSFLNGKGHTSYGSIEQDGKNLALWGMDPWFTNVAAELSSKLLKPRELQTHYIDFDRDSLFSSDPAYQDTLIDQYIKGGISFEYMQSKLNRPTKREGFYLLPSGAQPLDVVLAQAEKALSEPAPQQQPQQEPEETKEETVEVQRSEVDERAVRLTTAVLDRLKKRITKSIEKGDTQLSDHFDIVRSSLDGLNSELAIERLNRMQAELDAVLAEQRNEVIERWDTKETAAELWKS